MARPFNPELTKAWKVILKAELAARVELAIWDSVNNKPEYGKRGALLELLLEDWLAGKMPHYPIQPRTPQNAER